MTKRLRDAVDVVRGADVLKYGVTRDAVDELLAALDEARQPVTVTPDQAVEILVVMLTTFGESASQEERDALSTDDKQEIVLAVTAILEKAKELGL